MKKILLLSDTHGFIDKSILKYVDWADEVWHAGDIGSHEVADKIEKLRPLRAVFGNIDDQSLRSRFPEHQKFQCEDMDVWMTHIGGYPGNYDRAIRKEIQKHPPDLFVCGHSHILKVMPDKKLELIHMNPGSVGKYGFQQVRTMLRFVIDKEKVSDLEIIEFKR